MITGHSFRSRDHSFASGISGLSISLEDDKPEPEVFASSAQFGLVELNNGAKTLKVDESRQSRPKVYFSTEFDAIAMDDEDVDKVTRSIRRNPRRGRRTTNIHHRGRKRQRRTA